jgi:hypothetical protein
MGLLNAVINIGHLHMKLGRWQWASILLSEGFNPRDVLHRYTCREWLLMVGILGVFSTMNYEQPA